MDKLEGNPAQAAYEAKLADLLRTSSVTPGTYSPPAVLREVGHAAVLLDGAPFILCGPAGDEAACAQAEELAATERLLALVVAGHFGFSLSAGTVEGADVTWPETLDCVVTKTAGEFLPDVARGDGRIVAMVLGERAHSVAMAMCIADETARALDPSRPELGDGEQLRELALAAGGGSMQGKAASNIGEDPKPQ